TVLENSPRINTLATSSGCIPPSTFDGKVGAIDIGGDCDVAVYPVVTLSNVGLSTIITSAERAYGINGETEQIFNWTGNLNLQSDVEITLPLVEFQDTSDFTITLVSINGTIDDNTLNNSKTVVKKFPSVYTSSTVMLSLTTDVWGDETSWELIDGNTGTIIDQGGNYSGNQTITEAWQLADGCYTFIIYDGFGDGIC